MTTLVGGSRAVSRRRPPLSIGLVLVGAVLASTALACGGDAGGSIPATATAVSEEHDEVESGLAPSDGDDADGGDGDGDGTDELASNDPDDPGTDPTVAPAPAEPGTVQSGAVEGDGPEELGEGVVLDLSLLSDGGDFDPDLDTTVDVVVDLEGLDTDAILEINYDLDIVITRITGTLTELIRPDGSGVQRVIVNRDVALPELAGHTFTFSGVVEASDGSFELPFERTIRFEITEVGEAPVEELELVGGALTVEASRRWAVVSQAVSFSRLQERELFENALGLELDETEALVELVARDFRAVTVRRALRPRFLDDLEVLARGLPEALGSGEFSDPEPVEVGGSEGWRVVRTLRDAVQTIDLLEAGDEVFIVQATSRPEPSRIEEVAAVRDSLRFHPDEFDRLTHVFVEQIWLTVEGEPYFRIDTTLPADWVSDPEAPARLTSPGGRRLLVRQSFPAGDLTLEEFVVDVIEQSVPVGAEATYELGERGGLDAATISIVGDPIGDAKVVILTDGDLFETTTVRDDPDDPDPALISLIAASVRPVGPPSTN